MTPRKTNEKKQPDLVVVNKEPERESVLPAPVGGWGAQGAAVPCRRFWRTVGVVTLRGLLLVLLLVGLVCSLTPQGRAVTRATMILPALISANQPLPLQIMGEPIN